MGSCRSVASQLTYPLTDAEWSIAHVEEVIGHTELEIFPQAVQAQDSLVLQAPAYPIGKLGTTNSPLYQPLDPSVTETPKVFFSALFNVSHQNRKCMRC